MSAIIWLQDDKSDLQDAITYPGQQDNSYKYMY